MKIKFENGPEISRLVLGLWRLSEWKISDDALLQLVKDCIDLGMTTFDHADIYGDYTCESLFGRAMKLEPSLRNKIELISKCGIKIRSPKFPERKISSYDYSYEHIIASAEQSLKNLKTDHLDILLLHRPSPFFNPAEVAKAFSELKTAGKVLHFGVSNFSVPQYKMLQAYLDMPLVTNQVEISPYCLEHFDNGNIEFFIENKIKPMAWSPLAGGNIMTPAGEKGNRIHSLLKTIGAELETDSIDIVAYAWLMQHPASAIPVLGTGKLKRIKNAVAALDLKMSTEQWLRIYVESMGKPLP